MASRMLDQRGLYKLLSKDNKLTHLRIVLGKEVTSKERYYLYIFMLYKFVQTKESPCEGACLYLEGLCVIGNWACLMCPLKDWEDGEG